MKKLDDRRIAEIEAAASDQCPLLFQEVPGLLMEIRRLRSLVSDATGILHDAPELNMCNYTGNQVAELNYAVIQAYSTSWKGRNTSSPTRASPYPASRRPGTNPLSARESPGASGHTTCATPSPTLDEAKADAAQQIKDAGYAAEIKGITLQGMTIPTDRESQSMITGAVVGTLLDPTKTTRWQTATTQDGMPIFIELPAPQLQAIGQAVRNHVQRCFDVRDAKFAAVAVLATPKAVADWLTANLATDWPE